VTLDNTEGAESSVYIAYYDASTAYFEVRESPLKQWPSLPR